MNLGLITTSFPERGDGSEAAGAFVADFATALAQQGVAVTVIAAGKAESMSLQEPGYTVRRFACPRLPLSLLSPLYPAHWLPIVKTMHSGWRTLEDCHRREDFNHVLALWALPSGAWARQLHKTYGVPYSVWCLGSDIWSLGRFPIVRKALRAVLCDAQARYADGQQLQEDVARLAGIPCTFLASSRTLTSNRQQPAAISPPYRLAFLGRWHPNKGADLLLDALGQLAPETWRHISEFRYCGGGPMEVQVRTAVELLQRQGRPISLGGYLNRYEATDLLCWADWLVIPSRVESIPVIFSDALQARCRIISTPVGDLSELVPLSGGLVATAASAKALADCLSKALSASAEAAPPQTALLERFTPSATATAFINHLTQLSGTQPL